MRNSTLYVEKSLSGLREIRIAETGRANQDALNQYRTIFYAEEFNIQCRKNFGNESENRIHVYTHGSDNPIEINDVTFDSKIKDIFHWEVVNKNAKWHRFTLSGKLPNDKYFECEFGIGGETVLPAIVYAMLFVAETHDIDKAKCYWSNLTSGFSTSLSIKEKFNLLYDIHEFTISISQKYSFLKLFLQTGLEKLTKEIRESLSLLECLR